MVSAVRSCRSDVVAHLISSFGSPPVLAIAIALLAGLRAGGVARASSSIFELLISACAVPALFTFLLFRSGRTTTIDLRERTERILPSAVTALCCTLAWVWLRVSEAPASVSALAIAMAAQMVLLALITLRWKVSYHAAAAASLVAVGHSLDNSGLTAVLLGLACSVGWARVHQRRHTFSQVAVGAMTMAPIALLT